MLKIIKSVFLFMGPIIFYLNQEVQSQTHTDQEKVLFLSSKAPTKMSKTIEDEMKSMSDTFQFSFCDPENVRVLIPQVASGPGNSKNIVLFPQYFDLFNPKSGMINYHFSEMARKIPKGKFGESSFEELSQNFFELTDDIDPSQKCLERPITIPDTLGAFAHELGHVLFYHKMKGLKNLCAKGFQNQDSHFKDRDYLQYLYWSLPYNELFADIVSSLHFKDSDRIKKELSFIFDLPKTDTTPSTTTEEEENSALNLKKVKLFLQSQLRGFSGELDPLLLQKAHTLDLLEDSHLIFAPARIYIGKVLGDFSKIENPQEVAQKIFDAIVSTLDKRAMKQGVEVDWLNLTVEEIQLRNDELIHELREKLEN